LSANVPQAGRVLLFTGDGKGKTTAALGLGLRAYGRGLRVCVVQFIKNRTDTGEVLAGEMLGDRFEILPAGAGFVREPGGTPEDRARAAEALGLARAKMTECDVLVLDEVNVAVDLGLIAADAVLDLIGSRPAAVHVVLTGRNAPAELTAAADTVTDMAAIKHPFGEGRPADAAIDF